MDERRPKRRLSKDNPYRIYEIDHQCYVAFQDGEGHFQNVEVGKEVFEEFDSFELDDKSYLNEWDKHMEHSEVWESSL